MRAENTETTWLSDDHEFSLTQLADLSGMTEPELRELVDFGAVTPLDSDAVSWSFSGKCLPVVRTAYRLRISFELDPQSLALTISLLERIHALELQLRSLRAQTSLPIL